MSGPVLASIMERLDGAGVPYRHVEHEPARTCEASAAARGERIEIGGKSLVFKIADRFALLVLSAALRAPSSGLRRAFGVRRLRFASAVELETLTGLVPGSVPPFGAPILPLPLYLDHSILRNRDIAFNAGSLSHSIIMRVDDWMPLANVERVVDVTASP